MHQEDLQQLISYQNGREKQNASDERNTREEESGSHGFLFFFRSFNYGGGIRFG
ncbi:MAG: hypothetical protein LBN24_07580 [Mediterranea sp.]|jgi:hypothetical protein|nr:hypothetical protein [Mediterranea sp.]